MALTDLTRISTSGIATGSTIDSPILRKDVDYRGSQVGVNTILFDSSDNSLKFKDSAKAKFGDSNDLEVYHDGFHSHIREVGTGDLRLRSSKILLMNENSQEYFVGTSGGSVELYFNDNQKFRTTNDGAVVTGILTASSFSGPIGNPSGISTFYDLRVTNNLTVEGTTTTLDTNLIDVDRVEIGANSNTNTAIVGIQSGTADIVNLFDGTTEVLTVKDGGKVGIGSVTPAQTLDIMSSDPVIRLTDTDPAGVYSQIDGAGGDLILAADGGGGSSNSFISLRVDGTSVGAEKVRINEHGLSIKNNTNTSALCVNNVRGTASAPSFNEANSDGFLVDVYNTGNPYPRYVSLAARGYGTSTADMSFWTDSGSSVEERLRITATGRIEVKGSRAGSLQTNDDDTLQLYTKSTNNSIDRGTGITFYTHDGSGYEMGGTIQVAKENGTVDDPKSYMRFSTQSGSTTTERLRIHSHGQLELKVPDANDALKITPSGTHANAKINFNTPGNGAAVFKVQGTERLSIDTSGQITNTGIETSFVTTSFASNFAKLDIRGTNIANSNHYILSYGEGHANDHQLHMVNTLGDIVFRTGSSSPTERLYIKSDGNVSVGSNGAAAEKFQVNGGNIAIIGGSYKIDTHPLVSYANFVLDGGNYAARLGSTGTSTIRHTQIYGGGSHIATFDGVNTRLGIGITNPNAKLHIASGTSSAVGDATNPALQIGSSANYRFAVHTTNEQAIIANKNGDDGIAFHTKTADGGSFGEAVRITSTGGLKFTGQTTTIETAGITHHTNNNLYIRGGSSGLILSNDDSTNTIQISESNFIKFETNDGSERLRIASDGEVKINGDGSGAGYLRIFKDRDTAYNANGGNNQDLIVQQTSDALNTQGYSSLALQCNYTGQTGAWVAINAVRTGVGEADLTINPRNNSTGDVERLRIESGGTVRTPNGLQSGGNSTGGFEFISNYSGKGFNIAAQYATQANGGSNGNDPVFSGWWGSTNTFRVNTDGKVKYGSGLLHAVQSKGFVLYPDNGSNNKTTIRVSGLVSGCFIFQMGYYNSAGQGEGGFACAVSGYMTTTNQYTIDNIKAPYAHANSSISSISKQNSYFEFTITNSHSSYTGGGTCGIIGDQEMVITVTYHS